MGTTRAFLLGIAVSAAAAALVWAWHASSDGIQQQRMTTLATRTATLQRDLDAARRRADALEAELDAAARELRAAQTRPAERGREPERAAVPASLPDGKPATLPPPAGVTPVEPTTMAPNALDPDALRMPEHQGEWDAVVAGALGREVERRLGRTLTAEQTASLVATLTNVRDASRRLNERPLDPADPASIREHAVQQEALLAADRAFRDELGMGVSAFVQGLSAGKVEEAFPPDGPP